MKYSKSPDEKTASGLRVIVCEPDKANRFLLEKVFEKRGYMVDAFNNAGAVLDQLATHSERYDLIVMNVCAPVRDDLKLVRDIRSLENNDHSTIPIIATTTAVHPDIKKRCQAEGISDVIMKPFDIGEFFKVIEGCMGQSKGSVECHHPHCPIC